MPDSSGVHKRTVTWAREGDEGTVMAAFACRGMGTMMLFAGLFWIVLLVGAGFLVFGLAHRWPGGPAP